MHGHRGIIYGTRDVLTWARACLNGRLLIAGVLLIAVPVMARAALFHAIHAIPRPGKATVAVYNWSYSPWFQYPTVACMICGLVVVLFASGRIIGAVLGRAELPPTTVPPRTPATENPA